MDARSLHCPNCGAVADPAAGRCPYCKARLATVSCPHCFALLFDGAAFCPHCGARRTRTESDATSVKCPGCRDTLRSVAGGWHTHLDILADRLHGRASPNFWKTYERIAAEYGERFESHTP